MKPALVDKCPMVLTALSNVRNRRQPAIDPETSGGLTNRRNQNARPDERISSTTAFAPLNNGSTVVIMSRKKAAASVAKC